jgi:hypothetical protein
MPKLLTIGTEEFEFPLEGENAGYGSEITDWAEAVTGALSTVERPGDLVNKTAQILNNVSSPQNISEFNFSPSIVASFEAKYFVERVSAGDAKREAGFIEGYYDGSDWIIAIRTVGNAGINFEITSLGQITYTSDNLPGQLPSSNIKFEAKVINKQES